MFTVQNSEAVFINGESHKLTLGQRLVNHLLGLNHKRQRYSVPADYLSGSEISDSGPVSTHKSASRSRSWANVCKKY